jgi:hypothetical protein
MELMESTEIVLCRTTRLRRTSFDPAIFRTYLLSLLPPVIGASPEEIESIFDDEFDERVTRFASEGTGVIYIIKRRDKVEGKLFLKSSSLQRLNLPVSIDDMPPTFSYILTAHLAMDSAFSPSYTWILSFVEHTFFPFRAQHSYHMSYITPRHFMLKVR